MVSGEATDRITDRTGPQTGRQFKPRRADGLAGLPDHPPCSRTQTPASKTPRTHKLVLSHRTRTGTHTTQHGHTRHAQRKQAPCTQCTSLALVARANHSASLRPLIRRSPHTTHNK
eukprot:1660593-Prymnesium_polylepis.2